MSTRFKPFVPNQMMLLPTDLRDWLPENHLVYFIADVVEQLDLSAIRKTYDGRKGGQPPYHPAMMVRLLFYAYCVGVPSSRKIEAHTHTDVAFRIIAGNQQPDHDTLCVFRRRHLKALAGLFVQVLMLCREAGLVKVGHVALDGTKVKANASRHKAMSYKRMTETEARLTKEIKQLLAEAESADAAEDALHGKGRRGDELPEELRHRESRLKKISEAKKALEEQAKEHAKERREEERLDRERREREGLPKKPGRPPKIDESPPPKAQRNFTDPESRIMVDGATKSFVQAYNGQAAVDVESQVILAAELTQCANDKNQVEPLVESVVRNTGEVPRSVLADSGYCSEANVEFLKRAGIDPLVAVERWKPGKAPPACRGRIPKDASPTDRQRRKMRTKQARQTYAKRMSSVEPVFGQIKAVRGFRQFLLRGVENVSAEWTLWCLTHNLLKLFRAGFA